MDAEALADFVAAVGESAIRLGTLVFIGKPTSTSVEFRFDRDPGDSWATHLYGSLVPSGTLTTEEFGTRLTIGQPVQDGGQWVVRVTAA